MRRVVYKNKYLFTKLLTLQVKLLHTRLFYSTNKKNHP